MVISWQPYCRRRWHGNILATLLQEQKAEQYPGNPIVGADGGEDAGAAGLRGQGAGPVGEAGAEEPQLHVCGAGTDTRQATVPGRTCLLNKTYSSFEPLSFNKALV